MSDAALFAHEKLNVYQHALAFFRLADEMAAAWDPKHAITDHFPRAAESIVVNLAEASAAFSGVKQKSLDVALGSTLECAACLDIAQVKELIDRETLALHKPSLARIFRMQMGLKKSWSRGVVREEPEAYGVARESVMCFHHEQLDAYRVALEFVGWFCGVQAFRGLPARRFRKMDGATTSMLLNIAEGNGRFSELDHRRFLEVAHRSAIKMAAQLDLCQGGAPLGRQVLHQGKRLLARVASMTAVMARGKGKTAD